ncbi:MAG: type II toxin-antitoxin system prevent-host-death family antitoxin [Acidobacteria bacterium]|nr:type II toxin-antitoxin system prevent-host-death family antitoxin [Acidobacteriota bacterium]
MVKFVHVRELKNKATAVLHEVEAGATVVVTRHGKPIATLRPFDAEDIPSSQNKYPTTLYAALRAQVEARYPAIKNRTLQQQRRDFERLTEKVRESLAGESWQAMDKRAKGDRYGLTR